MIDTIKGSFKYRNIMTKEQYQTQNLYKLRGYIYILDQ